MICESAGDRDPKGSGGTSVWDEQVGREAWQRGLCPGIIINKPRSHSNGRWMDGVMMDIGMNEWGPGEWMDG